MKKLYWIMIMIALVCALSGCSDPIFNGGKNNGKPTSTDSGGTSVAERPEVEAYRPPADLINIDLNADDPSTDKIIFKYDDEGRVSQCYYMIGEDDIYLSYSYEGTTVKIYGFSGSIVVADESFVAKTGFDPSGNFCKYQGYYFKGLTF